ncbi:transglutaminase domain-containing protein [Sellimonas caecigallum]|uniref:Transglutaminase-like domain-containing protein n=1 Tax=Sellimonas caecigallum TaxID=2592333 RepID=A0ABS7L934_9FIRM|nr:transglutaminase domain-containing protein [Sellimonas caecigallum]MBY0759492.1 hypothetical protein [Sellimonas caecigallum]OUP00709.1 hypothetical protein B5F37_10305 [Drancourtella sp. An210]
MRKREKNVQKKAAVMTSFVLLAVVLSAAEGCGKIEMASEEMAVSLEEKEVSVPVEIRGVELEVKYYFSKLDKKEKDCYKEILEGIQSGKEEIRVSLTDAKKVNEIFGLVLNDFPDIFWCSGQAQTTSYKNGEGGYSLFAPVYTYKGQEKEAMEQEIQREAEACIANYRPEQDSEYERIKYVYEYLIRSVDYETGVKDSQNIYSALVGKRSVCAGYARATQYLLEKLGVFCTYVTGKSEGQPHAWNLVQCDGKYYYVDTTWGDPVFRQDEGMPEISEEQKIQYDYLCCSDEELFRTHSLDDNVEMPACVSLDANYYVKAGKYYQRYDQERIKRQLNQDIAEGNVTSVFKFSDKKSYEEARKKIVGEDIKEAAGNLAKRYGLTSVRYSYQEDPRLYKVTVYWQYG